MRAQRILQLASLLPLVAVAAPAANDIQTSGSFVSTVAPGTPPLEVTSTTRVDNLNAQYLDGWSAASFLRPLENVVTVSPSGGDFTSIQAALDSITDAADANRYTVLVGPGVYSEKVTLKSWVSVVGAGRGVTTVSSTGGEFLGLAATVVGATAAGLRDLTVLSEAQNSSKYAVGLLVDGTLPDLRNLEIKAYQATDSSIGIYNANNASLSLVVVDSEIGAISSPHVVGIYNASSGLELRGSDVFGYFGVTTAYAIQNDATSGSYLVTVRNTELQGGDAAVLSDGGFTTQLQNVYIVGAGPVENGGSNNCLFVVSGVTGYASTCPP
jgi:hypothetical protein